MSIINFLIIFTVVTGVLLLVKKVFGAKLSPKAHMLLWLVLAVQVMAWPLAQVLPEADWSLRSYVPQVTDVETTEVFGDWEVRGLLIGDEGQYYDVEKTTTVVKVPLTGEIIEQDTMWYLPMARLGKNAALILWATGSMITLLAMIFSAGKQRKVLAALPCCSDETALCAFASMKRSMNISRPLSLKTGAPATMLAGLRQPTVYLAAGSNFDEEELKHVFAHELTHYKHHDLWLNLASAGMLCIFWWNPVMWLAFRRFHLDMEMYCDWDAVKVTGDRKEYARVLVKAAAGQKRFVLATTSLVNEEHQVTKRVKLLAGLKKPKVWVSALAAAILLGVCVGFAVNPPAPERLGIYDEFQQLFVYENLEQMDSSANWIYGNSHYAGQQIDLYRISELLIQSDESVRHEMPQREVEQMLTLDQFDYWLELTMPHVNGPVILAHHQDAPDGQGETFLLLEEERKGWRIASLDVAYELANSVKLCFGLEADAHDWRVCDGDKSWEEAMEIFVTQYGLRYTEEEVAFLNARNEGTFRESDSPKVTDYTVEMVSEQQNAVLFRWIKETTYYNDIMGQVEIWAGGNHELRENSDGSQTIWDEYTSYLLNDGEGWYHVKEIIGGYNAELCVNEDGSLKDGLINYG